MNDPQTWRWLGGLAVRHGVEAVVRDLPEDFGGLGPYDEGVAAGRRSEQVRRPRWATEALAARVRRTLHALSVAPKQEDGGDLPRIAILKLTRRTAGPGLGGTFDLVVAVDDQAVTITGLNGTTLLTFAVVRARALEEGLLLPPESAIPPPEGEGDDEGEGEGTSAKKKKGSWFGLVARALKHEVVELLAPGESVEDAIAESIRRVVMDSPRCPTHEGLDRGHVLEDQGRLVIRQAALARAVHRALPNDKFGRESLATAARTLGMIASPTLANAKRPRGLWAFPLRALAEQECEPEQLQAVPVDVEVEPEHADQAEVDVEVEPERSDPVDADVDADLEYDPDWHPEEEGTDWQVDGEGVQP